MRIQVACSTGRKSSTATRDLCASSATQRPQRHLQPPAVDTARAVQAVRDLAKLYADRADLHRRLEHAEHAEHAEPGAAERITAGSALFRFCSPTRAKRERSRFSHTACPTRISTAAAAGAWVSAASRCWRRACVPMFSGNEGHRDHWTHMRCLNCGKLSHFSTPQELLPLPPRKSKPRSRPSVRSGAAPRAPRTPRTRGARTSAAR